MTGYALRSNSASAAFRPPLVAWLLGIAAILGLVATSIAEEAKVVFGKEWPANDRIAIDDVDHQDWNRLVKAYVDAKGNVDYSKWSNQAKGINVLDDYLNHLSRAAPETKSARNARLAFWINAYNAVVVRVLIDQPPTPEQQRSLPERFWSDWLLQVGDKQFSLDQIENGQLRTLQDPRIHFAIVCGAKGCPRLRDEAYAAETLESQLSQNSRDFFADPTKFKFNPTTKQLKLSPILKWYASDFGLDAASRLKSIAPYLPDAARQGIGTEAAPPIDYLDYDTDVNEQAKPDTAKSGK
jgi:hypothetical protein